MGGCSSHEGNRTPWGDGNPGLRVLRHCAQSCTADEGQLRLRPKASGSQIPRTFGLAGQPLESDKETGSPSTGTTRSSPPTVQTCCGVTGWRGSCITFCGPRAVRMGTFTCPECVCLPKGSRSHRKISKSEETFQEGQTPTLQHQCSPPISVKALGNFL